MMMVRRVACGALFAVLLATPAFAQNKPPAPQPSPNAAPSPPANADLMYGAYQRGAYLGSQTPGSRVYLSLQQSLGGGGLSSITMM